MNEKKTTFLEDIHELFVGNQERYENLKNLNDINFPMSVFRNNKERHAAMDEFHIFSMLDDFFNK